MSTAVESEKVISVFNEPGFVVFEVHGIKMKLPSHGTVDEIHDTSQNFLRDLFLIDGVEKVFNKYGVIIEKTVT